MEGMEKGRKEAVETNVVHSGLFDTKKKLLGAKGDLNFRISDLVKNSDETDI